MTPDEKIRFRQETGDAMIDLLSQWAERVASNLERDKDPMTAWETLRKFAQIIREHKVNKTLVATVTMPSKVNN